VRGFSAGFVRMLLVSTFGAVAGGAAAPVLPRFLHSRLGASDAVVGVVVAVTPFCGVVSGLLAGPQVDRIGRRPVALAGVAAAAAGSLLLAAANSLALAAVARAVYGLGTGCTASAVITWATDEAPVERRGRALSVYGLTVWVGLSVGPQVGEAVARGAGYRSVWLFVAALEVAALAVVLVAQEPPRPVAADPRPRRLVPRGAARPALLIMVAAYGEGVLTAFLVLHLIDRGVHGGAGFGGAASVFTVFALSVIACRIATAAVLDRFRAEAIAAAAFTVDAAGLALIAGASSFGVAAAGAALMGAAFAVLYPALALVASRASAVDEQGAALGSFGASYSLGLALGSLLGGAVASAGGTVAAHLSAAGAAAAAAISVAARARR